MSNAAHDGRPVRTRTYVLALYDRYKLNGEVLVVAEGDHDSILDRLHRNCCLQVCMQVCACQFVFKFQLLETSLSLAAGCRSKTVFFDLRFGAHAISVSTVLLWFIILRTLALTNISKMVSGQTLTFLL